MRVHYFNPENDLALASGIANYTAPAAAQRLHAAGAALPLWYADGDDRVLCSGVNAQWLEQVRRDFGIGADVFDHNWTPQCEQSPWGWSAAAKRALQQQGCPIELLPSDSHIEVMRMLSHRRTAMLVARQLASLMPTPKLTPAAIECFTAAEAEQAIDALPQAIAKAPWSSSGRGVASTLAMSRDRVKRMAADAIRRQGSVMIEEAYDKTSDFAKIYECRQGRCSVVGTSVFATDSLGAYTGNLLASESERLKRLIPYCDMELLSQATEALRSIIEREIAPTYSGILGVDMLATADGRLDAVVEINLRHTMGYVACRFADLYLADGVTGTFSVEPTHGTPPVSAYSLSGHKLVGGTLCLVPPSTYFTIKAMID